METFCTVIFNLWVWGVKFKHSNNERNFSSKMKSWVTDPGSQRMCRWEKSDSTTRLQGNVDNHTSFYPTADSGRMFSQGGWATLSAPRMKFPSRKGCNHRLEGSKLGFWVRWEPCFLLLGKGYIWVLSQFAHLFLYERNPTLRGNCDSIRQSGRLKTSVKLASIHNVKHGGPLPFSFEVSTHLETLYTLCIHSRSTPLNKPHRLVPKTISILPPSSLSTNLNSKSCQSILSFSI